MTLISRSAYRLSRRAGQQAKQAQRVQVAGLSTAAKVAQQVPAMLRADNRVARTLPKAKEGESFERRRAAKARRADGGTIGVRRNMGDRGEMSNRGRDGRPSWPWMPFIHLGEDQSEQNGGRLLLQRSSACPIVSIYNQDNKRHSPRSPFAYLASPRLVHHILYLTPHMLTLPNS